MAAKVVGLDDLNRKLRLMKSNFDGPPIKKLVMAGAREFRDEARRNLPRKVTGNLWRSIQAVGGRKASRYGALAIARTNAWKAPHAILVERGTNDRTPGKWKAMRIWGDALAWFGALGTTSKIMRYGTRTAFLKRVKGSKPIPFWDNAVATKAPKVQADIEAGCVKIVEDSVR